MPYLWAFFRIFIPPAIYSHPFGRYIRVIHRPRADDRGPLGNCEDLTIIRMEYRDEHGRGLHFSGIRFRSRCWFWGRCRCAFLVECR